VQHLNRSRLSFSVLLLSTLLWGLIRGGRVDNYNFTYKGQEVSPIDLQYGIMGKESTWGKNTTPRYEPKFHTKLKTNKKWVPTPAERRIIKERGYDEATRAFSTSYGPYQILPETAYRYTSFAGNPEDLAGPASVPVYIELIKRMHMLSGGNLEKAMPYWNQKPAYLTSMMELINKK
jgi:hypothetical protein